jgi:tRNA(fMet)-specific endonuclease VapC
MESCLGYSVEVPIDTRDLVEAYADWDVTAHLLGKTLSKNDLWIAATAKVAGATLLTTDRDFDPLVSFGLLREWIDPAP